MRTLVATILLASLAACSTTGASRADNDPLIQETRVYLQTTQPETVSSVRYEEPLRYRAINQMFAILTTDTGVYLLETRRVCPSLFQDFHDDMRDTRSMRGRLRPRIDTIRGCTIQAIYRLPEQTAETTGEETGQNNSQEPN